MWLDAPININMSSCVKRNYAIFFRKLNFLSVVKTFNLVKNIQEHHAPQILQVVNHLTFQKFIEMRIQFLSGASSAYVERWIQTAKSIFIKHLSENKKRSSWHVLNALSTLRNTFYMRCIRPVHTSKNNITQALSVLRDSGQRARILCREEAADGYENRCESK